MTGDNIPEFTIGQSKSADAAALTKARARGEMYGFTGLFLSNFIERELRLMAKWQRPPKRVKAPSAHPPLNFTA